MSEKAAATPEDADQDKKPAADKKDAESKKPEPKSSNVQEDAVALFDNDVEIYCGQPMPQYNAQNNKAFRADSKRNAHGPLFAVVCEKHFIPRRKDASAYTSIINPALVPLVAYGKVYWPPAKQERYVFIYKSILGNPILKPDVPKAMGWKQEQVMEVVVHPLVNVLQDFRDKDFVHGAIRPTNMFDAGSGDSIKKIILGDCLSTPGSFTQPSLFETIERSMADPIARGVGTLPDDLYSFGVSLAVLMRTQDPLEGLDETAVIQEKIKHGSYAAITGKDRFKGSILELLRGLLHDDPSQRWTIDEVLVWMDGRRLSPKQAVKKKKAARPFVFYDEKYLQAPLLAMAMDATPSETAKVVEDESLEQWLARSLEDEKAVTRYQEALSAAAQAGRGGGYEDRLVANLSCALDPMAPIRFKNLRLMGDGIGAALYETLVLKQEIRGFVELFLHSIALNWVTVSENPNLDVGGLIGKFDSCRNFLRQKKVGYGIERCLYLLASEAPCLSPKLKDYFVPTPEDMMYAFEDICEKGKAPALFLDRHSIAFLSVKDSKAIDGYIYDLDSHEEHRRVLANLKTLATIQKRSKMGNFPALGRAFLKMLPCVFDRYHDRKVRDKIKSSVEKFSKTGDLVKMAGLLDNPDVVQKDLRAFQEAMVEYADLKAEKAKLSRQLENEKTFGRTTGKEFAALTSGALAMIVIAVTTFMFFSKNSIF